MKNDLLTTIFEKSNFTYLSDLKFAKGKKLVKIIDDIKIDDYSIEEWKELYMYLIEESIDIESKEVLKEELIKKIAK